MSLNNFITHIKQIGLPTGAKFALVAPFVDGTSGSSASTVSMLCSSAVVPGHSIMTNDLRYFGESTERPHGISYGPVSLSFYIDNDLSSKRYFDAWTSLVFNKETRELGYYDSYTRDVEIVVYDKNEKEIERIKLFEAYPKAVNELPLDYTQNTVLILSVQLVYKWWTSSKADDWKGDNSSQRVNQDQMPQYGTGGQNMNAETLGNSTNNTFDGQGIPANPDTPFLSEDAGSALQQAGANIYTDSTRGFTQAGNLFGISGVTSESYPNINDAFSNNSTAMMGNFGGFANGLSSLGGNMNNITPSVSQMSSSLGDLSTSMGSFSHLMGAAGGNGAELNTIAGQLAQSANYLSTVSDINGVPGYLNSVAANMSSAGAIINDSIGSIKAANPTFDRTSEIAFQSTANTFTNTGSILNQASTSLTEQ